MISSTFRSPLWIATSPETTGRLIGSAELKRGVDGEASEIVGEHGKAPRRRVQLDIARADVARTQAADDVQRIAVGILDVQRVDREAIAREAERRVRVLVADAGRRDDEPGVGDRDPPVDVRRAARAGDSQRERRGARDAADQIGQSVGEAEIDLARRDGDVERTVGRRAIDRAERHGARRGQPHARRLIEAQIDGERAVCARVSRPDSF